MRYNIEGTIVDTNNASKCWEEKTRWNGHNNISVATGSQWEHQKLYRSRKGRYYIERWSQWQGSTSSAEWVSPQEATRWLLLMEGNLPGELKQYVDSVSE